MNNTLSLPYKTFATLLLAAGCLTSVIVPTAHANLIVNGGFEEPDVLANHVVATVPSGWTFGDSSSSGQIPYVIDNALGGLTYYPYPEEGSQFLSLDANNSLTLYQTFTVVAAGTYDVTWYDNNPGARYNLSIFGSSSVYSQDYIVPSTATHSSWQSRSETVSLAAGEYTLQFRPLAFGFQPILDNVGLAPVPEPTTILAGALLLLPFGVQGIRRLRTRKQVA
jgi:hypothetical protein